MSFSGYRFSRPNLDPDLKQARGIATLIRNDVSFGERDTVTYKKGLESMLTEIIPSGALKTHLYILNVYSSPTDRLRNFTKLFTSAALQAKDMPLIVAGDFNAHSTLWGYATNDRKGINLAALAHLLEAKNPLRERWKQQKLNRRLRSKLTELNKKIEEHSRKLSAQQWDEVCNEADGKMRRGSKWSLLKNLFDDNNKPTKSNARITIERLIHLHTNEGTSPRDFADALADIYLPVESKSVPWVDPTRKNIHPTHNEGRIQARAKAILDKIKHKETKVLFVDAARYCNRAAYAVFVVDAHGSLVNTATVVTNFTHEAEEMAIAVYFQEVTLKHGDHCCYKLAVASSPSGIMIVFAVIRGLTTVFDLGSKRVGFAPLFCNANDVIVEHADKDCAGHSCVWELPTMGPKTWTVFVYIIVFIGLRCALPVVIVGLFWLKHSIRLFRSRASSDGVGLITI
ncbi:hypothetical protein HPB50_028145 [Hyalomma asiaticum]|nr:hypothetical protein HPB50_028145 [Hyalomma asiaticum]